MGSFAVYAAAWEFWISGLASAKPRIITKGHMRLVNGSICNGGKYSWQDAISF